MTDFHQGSISEKMFKHSPDIHCAIDKEGRFVKVSQACKLMLGYEASELEGKSFLDYVLPEDRERTLQVTDEIIRGHTSCDFENRYRRKSGKPASLMWSATWSDEDMLMFCVARNVSAQQARWAKTRESEQKYRALFENNPDLVFYENREGKVTEVNLALSNLFRHRKDAVTGTPAASFLPAEMAYVNQMSLQQALLGSTMRFDLELSSPGKEHRVYDTVKFPVVVNDEIVGAQTIAKDITPIVRSFELIEQQAKKLSTILESITDAFFALDSGWRFTYVNSVFADHEGYRKEELIGRSIWEMFPRFTSTLFQEKCEESASSGLPSRLEETYPSTGLTYRYKIYPSADGLSVYFTDITKEKKMQQELEKLSLVASNTDNGVVITDAGGLTEWVNEGFTKITGYTLTEMAGRKPGDLLQGEETDVATVRRMREKLSQGVHFSTALINYKKSGETFWVSMDITPIFDDGGKLVRHIAVQRDITSRKEAEADQLRMAEDLFTHNNDLKLFTYIVSHNLRAPVANALGLANLLAKSDKMSVSFDTSLAHLKTSLLRMDTVLKDVNTILSVRERQDVLEKEQVGLLDICRQALSYLQEPLQRVGGEIMMDMEETATVSANRPYLFSICYNLLSNAIKFRSEQRPLQVVVRSYLASNGYRTISFSDNGVGFDVERAGDNVFKLYKRFNVKQEGKGVGLFLVKTHVEAMGGRVEVRSQVDVGTKFIIYLSTEK